MLLKPIYGKSWMKYITAIGGTFLCLLAFGLSTASGMKSDRQEMFQKRFGELRKADTLVLSYESLETLASVDRKYRLLLEAGMGFEGQYKPSKVAGINPFYRDTPSDYRSFIEMVEKAKSRGLTTELENYLALAKWRMQALSPIPMQTVVGVQKRLHELGFDPGPVDGVWGPKTQESLKEFQRRNGFEATGRADQETLDRLLRRTVGEIDMNLLANDYLTIVVFLLNRSSEEMHNLAMDAMKRLELIDAKSAAEVGADGFQMILTSWGTSIVFDSEWADPLDKMLNTRGNLPAMSFRNGSAGVRNREGSDTLGISDGTEMLVEDAVWTFQNGKWHCVTHQD